ncbi:hypothetical protein [Pyruvatibacter mobilis]|uniref:hypothetical protein n=1 Tax=Pyruvatibacter mobilis TaxID=1712261 RepID=UPI003BAF3119
MERPEYVISGEVARLIPTFSESQRECRSTSVLLATMMAVPNFAKELLEPIGVRVGKTSRVAAFTEVVFRNQPDKSKDRPDGLLIVETGKRQWRAIIEAKVGNADLNGDQIQNYLGIARDNGIDAVITISNQFATLPTHHPVAIDRRRFRNTELVHWSWTSVLTDALLLLADDNDLTSSEKYVLSEAARYFDHEKSGITRFSRMNAEWGEFVASVQSGTPLRRDDLKVTNSVSSWFQEERDLALLLTRQLRERVTVSLSRAEKVDPTGRLANACDLVSSQYALKSTFEIPNAAADLEVTADIRRRAIICSMTLSAPKDRKSASARANWILRQLRDTPAEGVFIRAHWAGRTPPTQLPLAELREDVKRIEPLANTKDLRKLEVRYVAAIGRKFGQPTKFINELEATVPLFYKLVGQTLRAWVAPPPKYQQKNLIEETVDASNQSNEAETPSQIELPPREDRHTASTQAEFLSTQSAFGIPSDAPGIPAFLRRV